MMNEGTKGYVLIGVLLGIAITGMSIIYAHSYYYEGQYAGIGSTGIHTTIDGSIHIPNGIYLADIGSPNNYNLSTEQEIKNLIYYCQTITERS